MKDKFILTCLLIIVLMTSCCEVNTDDPKKAYKYWAGTNPPENMELLSAKYWQSAHWTREYQVYLKFKVTEDWWEKYVKRNQLLIVNDKFDWEIYCDVPSWFRPPKHSVAYGAKGFDQGSRYFRDTVTNICYIYEVRL